MKRRILALTLTMTLLFGLLSVGAMAADTADTYDGLTVEWDLDEVPVASGEEDPMYWKELHKNMEFQNSGSASVRAATGGVSFADFQPREVSGEIVRAGIDVSEFQKTIDWKAVAESGVEFAIIRVAVRGWGAPGTLMKDSTYVENIREAQANGILVGAYIYSQAITEAEARQEAQFLMQLLEQAGCTVDLPLVIDYEYAEGTSGYTGRLYNANLTAQEATDICNAFCDEVEKNGYESMTYANYSMLQNHMVAKDLDRVWLAHYTTKTSYSGSYEYWQCTSSGEVAGISGRVDLDFWFDTSGAPEQKLPFQDVHVGQWYYENVLRAYEAGIINGMTPTSFEPNTTASRGHVIAMLYRLEGSPKVSGTSSFTDLTEDFYRDAVLWAEQNHITNGVTPTSFAPHDPITREALVTLLYRMSGSPSVSQDLSGYADAGNISAYAKSAMAWAVKNGIIKGYEDKTLQPWGTATRAEVCTILMRYWDLVD